MLGFGKFYLLYLGLPRWLSGKESASSVGDIGLVPRSGRSPAEGNSNPFQYSWVEISWTEEPGSLQSRGWKRVGFNWAHTSYYHHPTPSPLYHCFILLANLHKVFETQLRWHVFQEFFNFSWPQEAGLTKKSSRCYLNTLLFVVV